MTPIEACRAAAKRLMQPPVDRQGWRLASLFLCAAQTLEIGLLAEPLPTPRPPDVVEVERLVYGIVELATWLVDQDREDLAERAAGEPWQEPDPWRYAREEPAPAPLPSTVDGYRVGRAHNGELSKR